MGIIRRFAILTLASLGSLPLTSSRPLAAQSISKTERAPAKDYAKLVRQLASSNQQATRIIRLRKPKVDFPAGYDAESQRRIDEVRNQLQVDFEQSLPHLIDALEDNRYCMTVVLGEGDDYSNYSVGDVCRDIIASQLEIYRDGISFFNASHSRRYNYPLINKRQLLERKGQSLAELQVEAIDWAKAKRLKELDEDDPDRADITKLEVLRKQVLDSGKPLPAEPLASMKLPNP